MSYDTNIGGLICVQKGNSYAMNLKTKTLEVLTGISNLHLIEIKDSGKQIYTSRQRKSTKYLMTSLLIGSFSDGQGDNLVIIFVTVQVATPVPTRNGAGFRIPRTESGTRKQDINNWKLTIENWQLELVPWCPWPRPGMQCLAILYNINRYYRNCNIC